MTYASEIRSRLATEVISVVVGPEGVVGRSSFTETIAGKIGTVSPSGLRDVVSEAVGRPALSAAG